jgi:phosphatidylglycerol:prolipoprotein diacylglycerol transferase
VDDASSFSVPMHPTQIYEGLLDVGLLVILLALMKKAEGRAKGKLAFLFVIGGYALVRFFMEFLRADHDVPAFLGMTGFQITLIFVFLGCAIAAPYLLKGPQADAPVPEKPKKHRHR